MQKLVLIVLDTSIVSSIHPTKAIYGESQKRNVPERMTVKVMVSHIAPVAIERDPIAELQ